MTNVSCHHEFFSVRVLEFLFVFSPANIVKNRRVVLGANSRNYKDTSAISLHFAEQINWLIDGLIDRAATG